MSRTSALGMFTNLPVLADAADITAVGTTMADRIEKYVNLRFPATGARDATVTVPEEGMEAYIGSNDTAEGPTYYNGTNWRLPWNMPWGRVTDVVIAADQTGITTEVDLTSYTATITAVANRTYKATWLLPANQVTTAGNQTFKISSDGSVSIIASRATPVAGSIEMVSGSSVVSTLAAGARVIKLRALTSAGTLSILSGSSVNGRFIIEDIGANGAPS